MNTPAAVRYPRGKGPGVKQTEALVTLEIGKGRILRESRAQAGRVAILAFGLMVSRLARVAETLNATLVDMRFVKPIDEDVIVRMAQMHDLLVTAEDGVVAGGAGSAVLEVLAAKGLLVDTLLLGIGDHFVPQGTVDELMKDNGLDEQSVIERIQERLKKHAR